jgi:chaperonin GroEL
MHATRAAVEEGVIPGGGVAFLRSNSAIDKLNLEDDEEVGAAIVKRALEEPTRQLVQNAGLEGSVVVQRLKGEKGAVGFDLNKEEYTDMFKAGIIDPTKVARVALQNAASIAGLLLTTETLLTEMPEKEEQPAMQGGGKSY